MRVVGFMCCGFKFECEEYISAEGGKSKGGTDEIFQNI
jgi:hypothetical protein